MPMLNVERFFWKRSIKKNLSEYNWVKLLHAIFMQQILIVKIPQRSLIMVSTITRYRQLLKAGIYFSGC